MPNKKKEISDSIKIDKKDVGSSEVQISALSEKIDYLTDHFKKIKMINIRQEDY